MVPAAEVKKDFEKPIFGAMNPTAAWRRG